MCHFKYIPSRSSTVTSLKASLIGWSCKRPASNTNVFVAVDDPNSHTIDTVCGSLVLLYRWPSYTYWDSILLWDGKKNENYGTKTAMLIFHDIIEFLVAHQYYDFGTLRVVQLYPVAEKSASSVT